MNILVTGGLGYIGSHTVVELIENNYEVIIIDNLSNSELFILDNIKKITGVKPKFYNEDLLDLNKTNEVINKHDIDGVIHFAAFKSVSESIKYPLKYYRNNLLSLINILRSMVENNISNKIPHIGWARISIVEADKLHRVNFFDNSNEKFFYFVHSFQGIPTNDDNYLATTKYNDIQITAAVRKGHIIGCQFHPEKSGENGITLINDFLEL